MFKLTDKKLEIEKPPLDAVAIFKEIKGREVHEEKRVNYSGLKP